jgi:hypothetical protein
MRAFQQSPPNVVFSFHALAGICSLPMLAARIGKDDKAYADSCRRYAEAYALGLRPGDEFQEPWMYFGTSAGSLPAWLCEQFKTPAFDLECDPSGPEKPCLKDGTDLQLMQAFQDMHSAALRTAIRSLRE